MNISAAAASLNTGFQPVPGASHHQCALLSERVLLSTTSRRVNVCVSNRTSKSSACKAIKSESLQVIGIGSRKDAVFDFCLESPFQSSSTLRFWSIHTKDSSQDVQLHQRLIGKDLGPTIIEVSEFPQLCSKAVVLVASAGCGLDHVTAIDIIKQVRSRNGFAMAILLKPFSFEGKRRLDEVKNLMGKLQEHTIFCIDIDTDALLKKELVTLDEALKTANSAVLLAINAISLLISETDQKVIGRPHNVKKIEVSEVLKMLDSYREAKIGFGVGADIKSSISQALFDSPFIDAGLGVLNGIVVCVLASSAVVENSDLDTALNILREFGEYSGDIILSAAHEPNLEPNVVVTTIALIGSIEPQAPQESNIFSRFVQHFPFIFKLLGRNHQKSNGDGDGSNLPSDPCPSKVLISPDSSEMENQMVSKHKTDNVEKQSEELETISRGDYSDVYYSSDNSGADSREMGLLEARTESFNYDSQIIEGTSIFQRERLNSQSLGPGYQIAQKWAKEKAGTGLIHNNPSIFHLPIGVKHPGESSNGIKESPIELSEPKNEEIVREQTNARTSISYWGALTDDSVGDFYDDASSPLTSQSTGLPKKQGILSLRAASMLEAERDSPKKWSPLMEMPYRGGVYQGRCQGGLPEGKGRLVLGNGSIYEGMWRYGRRSGPGAFYFPNGDVFQGSWRDDVMHGKGWFYFHTGDRWFANFWKGKANGESRFYSKCGDIVFGNFKDGWRDGKFLCINVDGARSLEIWNEGILVSSEQLAPGVDAG